MLPGRLKAAGYHQYHAAKKGLQKVIKALASDGKAGVIWHTQGSGKSLLMAFFAGMLVHHDELQYPTLVVLTDRNDLDNQLFGTFSRCAELFGQDPQQVTEVAALRHLLDRQAGGVIFATIQKFRPEDGDFDVITERRNVVVFVDEAHRSQYGLRRSDRGHGGFRKGEVRREVVHAGGAGGSVRASR